MKLLLLLALFLAAGRASQCESSDTACQAFEWALPIWTSANVRWGASAGWFPNGTYSGGGSASFAMNTMSARRANIPPPGHVPPMGICNSNICSGQPWTLNPGPVVAPNVDTLYAAGFLDLSRFQLLQVPNNFDPAIGGADRYYSVTFLDMYMNNLMAITNKDHPNGGLFCLIYDSSQHVYCDMIAAHRPITAVLTLPKTGLIIARVWSSGQPTAVSCRNDTLPAGEFDPDGCAFLNNLGLANGGLGPQPALITPFTTYKTWMAPPSPTTLGPTCYYHYGQQPCGSAATADQQKQFWNAVCHVMSETAPNAAEAAYVNSKFGNAFGIWTTGCNITDSQYVLLNKGFTTGYPAVDSSQDKVGILGHQNPNEWLYLPFDGTWAATETDLFTRAIASHRLHWMVTNAHSAYWAAFTDSRPPSQRNRLSCANDATYRVKFSDQGVVPVDYDYMGFWSVTVYDTTWFLVGSSAVYGVRSNQAVIPQPFYISANCAGLSPCVPAPNGEFQLLFRGYRPLAGLSAEGDYNLPKVQLCKGSKGQGC
jgi:hypothetical protein